jgi:hypothetical protein
MPWKSEGMEWYNQLHEEVCQDQDALEKWGNGVIQSDTWRGASGPTVEWRTEIRDWIQK